MARRNDDGPSVGNEHVLGPDLAPDRVADALYALPPEGFVARRDTLARAARAAGDRDAARAIAALRKPTLSAWALNLLVREERTTVEQLLDLGEALREAERTLSPDALRGLSAQRNDVVAALVATASGIAARAGTALPPAASGEVQSTLLAALALPEVADAVLAGRLVKPAQYAGFGSAAAGTATPPRRSAARRGPALRSVPAAEARRREEEARQEAARAVREAEERLAAARAERDRIGEEVAGAERERDAVAARLEQAREQVRDLERRQAEAVLEARAAGRRRAAAEEVVREAEAGLRRARGAGEDR